MKCKNIDDKIQKNKQKANNKFRINNIKKQELKEQGVTMLSLVVTIVVLLILSGITIKFALNDNGVIKQSKLASEKYKNSTIQEQAALNEVAKQMSTASSSSGTSGGSGGSSSSGNTDELMQQIEILQDQVDMLNNQIDDLKTKQATGNATTSQVLSGATFSTSAGIGLTGTMKNNGAWSANTTGSGNITIPAGYHNGQGYVSGAGAYNKGVSDADARVNTGSASYKNGYANGEKVNQKKYLYNAGDECTDITGGWIVYPLTYSGWTMITSFTKNSDNIYLPTSSKQVISIGPAKKIDVTNIDFIEAESEEVANENNIEIHLYKTTNGTVWANADASVGSYTMSSPISVVKRSRVIDVSKITGEWYIGICSYNGMKPKIKTVWMR